MSSILFAGMNDLKEFAKISIGDGPPLYQPGPVGKSGIPTAIYKVVKHPKEDMYDLVPVQSRWQLPPKLYGDLRNNAVRVWNRYAKLYHRGGGSVGMLATGDSGTGKALKATTKVKTPKSWTPIKDIKVGDLVMTPKGNPTKVIGVYPQGMVQLYEVSFMDGRKIECCLEHLWSLNEYGNIYNYVTVNTETIIKYINENGAPLAIPLVSYNFNKNRTLTYTEQKCIKNIANNIKNNTIERIPQYILKDEDHVRLYLLSTLLNNNDNITMTSASITLVNEFLVNDVIYLARSLGLIAICSKDDDKFNINIDYEINNQLIINSITPTTIDEAVCIEVDDPSHLYVAEDFIVTHNTETSKTICNLALDNNMPVIEVSGIKCTQELVEYLAKLHDVVLFLDEFAKNFGNLQETMLTTLSDMYKTNKLFIISENETYMINKYILNSPSRVWFHFRYKKLDKLVIDEYLEDFPVSEKFIIELNEKYDKTTIFSFNHLIALVEEHLDYPNDSLEKLIKVLNVSVLDVTSIYKVTKIYDPVAKEEVKFNHATIGIDAFNRGSYCYLRLISDTNNDRGVFGGKKSNIRFSKNDIMTTLDDGDKILISCEGLIVTLENIKDSGGSF